MDLVSKASEIGKELARDPKFIEYKKLYNSVYKDEKNKDMIDDFLRNLEKEGEIVPGELWDNKEYLWWSSYAN